MTDTKEKNTGRAKLTLGTLKLSKDSSAVPSKKDGVSSISSGAGRVEVAIKGRRRSTLSLGGKSRSVSDNALSMSQIEERKKLLSKAEEDGKNVNYGDVLNKIGQASAVEKEREEERAEIRKKREEEERKRQQEKEERIQKRKQEREAAFDKQGGKRGSFDDIDVFGKIKSSIDESRAVEAERERSKKTYEPREGKAFEDKEATASEGEGKDKFYKDSYKSKTSERDGEDDEWEGKKTSAFKKDKSHKRSLKTFLVGEGEEDKDVVEKFDFRRVNKGIKSKHQKNVKQDYQKIYQEIQLPEFITVSDLAEKMNEKKGDVVKKLITMGVMATANQTIDADTAELVATEMGHKVQRVSASDVENVLENLKDSESAEMKERMPVVTIMGHVDHGKTSLLDAIRSTNVVKGESGGITQHIGASRVMLKDGKFITFLDTPGHEAFTAMRLRGAHVTDMVVLVVAADDGVKEQTIEAINHTKAAKVPMIVAINKIDKPEADATRVKNELLNYDIVLEEFGGDVMSVEVSAKSKINLDKLKETILLQAEILDLKAPFDTKASGAVIESRVDNNKGVIATLLVEKGTLKIGDLVLAGMAYGKIRKMSDDTGKSHKEAIPSMAVEVMGLDKVPDAGEKFYVVKEEKQAREIIAYRENKKKEELNKSKTKTLDQMLQSVGDGKKELPVIIKADVHGSVEAIIGSLEKLGTDEVAVRVIHSGTGGITDSDVTLASASNALIIAFNVRASASTKEMAKSKDIDIRYHSIIYNVVDEVKAIMGGLLEPITREEHLGQAEVRQVFKVTGAGKIAGCMVIEGVIQRGAKVRVLRDNIVIYDGKLKALKRFKDDVKEVKQNFECGLSIEGYDDIKEGDVIECYNIFEEKREL